MKFMIYSKGLFIFFNLCIASFFLPLAAQTSWKGTVNSAWSTAGNWTNGVPTAATNTVIGDASFTGTFQPLISSNVTINNFTINTGALNMGGFTLSINGTAVFTGGTINNGSVSATGGSTTFAGTTFNAGVNVASGALYLNGSTFNNIAILTQNGTGNISGSGGNTFNSTASISNSGAGNLIAGNTAPDIFNGDVAFTNTGSAALYIAYNSLGNQFKGNVTFNNTGNASSIISSFGPLAAAAYSGNIVINNTSAGGIYFGSSGGLTTLAAAKTISVGGSGYTKGNLVLRNFTQSGSATQTLSLTGAALLQLGPAATFGGNVDFSAPQLLLNGCTFNGTALLAKKGTTDNVSVGGNIFNGVTTLSNSGSGTLDLGDISPERFNTHLTINNTGTSRIQIGISSVGNLFNGNVTINHGGNTPGLNTIIARNPGATATINGNLTLNCTNLSTGSGILIANEGAVTINGNVIVSSTNGRGVLFAAAAGTVTLAAGYTISDAGTGTYTTGTLALTRFTQIGGTAQNIILTGTADMALGPNTQFNGPVNFSAPDLLLNGCVFNSTCALTKTGSLNSTSTGNNIFNGATTVTNSGTGFMRMANTSMDDFNSNATFIQTGSGLLQPAYAKNCTFSGDLSTIGSATAITFGTGGGGITFNGTASQTISGSITPVFNNITIANIGNTVTCAVDIIVANNLLVSNGTFNLAGFTANRATVGGTLSVSNNATLKIGGTNTYPINYTTNTLVVASTVEYSGTNQNIANLIYGNLKLSSSSGMAVKTFPGTALTIVGNLSSIQGAGTGVSFTAASNITINGNVSIGASTMFSGGVYSHNIGGNWSNSGTFNGSTGTITFTGSGTSVSGSGIQNFNNLTVAASQASFSTGSITLTGNLATTGAGSFSQVSGGTFLMTGSGKTISGSGISLENLTISGTVTTGSSLNLTGNLSVSGGFVASAGTVTMGGTSKSIAGAGNKGFSILSITGTIITDADFSISSGLTVTGSLSASAGTATFTGMSTLSGTANLFNTNINGVALQLSTNSNLGIANVLTISSGVLNVTSSVPNTINFNGTVAQNINAITYNNLTLSNSNTKTAIAGLTVNNNISIATGATFIAGAFTHSIYADWNNAGSFVAGTGTIQFLGSQNTNIIGSTAFNILTVNNATDATGVILQSNISASIVNMVLGTMFTELNTLTIFSSRTGNGIILGNIQRTHTFTTGVAYAFEGPYNTITFSSVSAVTSITTSVSKGSISDFPFGGSISRVYAIAVPVGIYNATIRLHYEDDELNGNIESSMGLWNYNGSTWSASGKTANNTTANYVEKSGLTNITNRWTCSDNSNVALWNGSVSTDWNTAANWTVLQGSASRPPLSTDIVNIGTAAFTYQPIISNPVSVKNINFGSVQAVSLSLSSGGSLVSGDIRGIWSNSVTHIIDAGNQSITINGDFSLGDVTSGHAINLNIASGTVTVAGSLSQDGGAGISFSGPGALIIDDDFTHYSGTFTAGTGTVIYNGSGLQEIGYVNYNNLTINKSAGTATIYYPVNITGNLLISSGELNNYSTAIVTGDVTISPGATLNNDSIFYIGGNWANRGNYVDAGINMIFDGSGTQNIPATEFNNLTINKPVGSSAVLTGNVIINGDLTVISGTLNIQAFDCNRSVQGGTIVLGDSATLIVGGNNPPTNFSNGSLANSSTVIADGSGPQIIFGLSFGHLVFRNAGIKTLVSAITVNGNLTIENGATFDGGSQTLTLNGNWINNGTFTSSTGTTLCNGTLKSFSGVTTFNRLTVSGSYVILNDLTFNGLLNITDSGSITCGGNVHTILHGDLINSGILYSLGTTIFSGDVLQTLSLINATTTVALIVNFNGSVSPVLNSTSVPQFGYLTINNTGGINPSVGWDILYSLTIGSGASFNGGTSTHNMSGAVTNNGTITSSGRLNFIPSTAKTINLGNDFSSTGTVVFGGTGAMTLAGTPSTFHNLVISNTDSSGITPSAGWSVTNNFTINDGATLKAGIYTYLIGGNVSNSGIISRGASLLY